MHIPDKLKKPAKLTYYFAVNGIFAACIYFGFFGGIEGAANVAVFIAWVTGIAGTIFFIGIAIDSTENAKGDLLDALARREPSAVPFWFDLTFDLAVVAAFVWSGYYWVTFFYIISIHAGKQLRDIPADVMLKNLKESAIMKNVHFGHMIAGGVTMVIMAIVALMLDHTTVVGALQDILTVIGTLALTLVYARFGRRS